MTDQETSGASAIPAPAETTGAPAAAGSTQEFGTFGSTRGSGLARGKRPASTAASAASAPTGDYKPTSIEVVVPQREYRNPFGDSTPVADPAPAAPIPAAIEAPPTVQPAPVAAQTAPAPAPSPAPIEPARKTVEDAPEKAVLNILPPAEVKRPPVHWGNTPTPPEGSASPGVFQTRARREENRGERPPPRSEPREGGYQGRDPRRDFRQDNRQPAERREPDRIPVSEAVTPKSGGFFSWLKGLFGAKPAAAPAQTEFRREGDQLHRRRRRGGRGRRQGEGQQGQSGAPREGGQPEYRGGRQDFRGAGDGGQRDGQRRRRHRGGRGRDRGDSRPEGWQGGGAI